MTSSITLEIAKSSDQEAWGPAALDERRERTREHLARLAEKREYWVEQNRYYYKIVGRLLQFLVEPGKESSPCDAAQASSSLPCDPG